MGKKGRFYLIDKYNITSTEDKVESYKSWLEKQLLSIINKPDDWINVEDDSVKIPYTKVCIWDGGNTFWAYLKEIKETSGGRELVWNVITPDGYGECVPLFWKKILPPKGYSL